MNKWLIASVCIAMQMGAKIAHAEPAPDVYRVDLSVGEANYQGVGVDADWGVGQRTRVQLGGGYAHGAQEPDTLNVRTARAGLEQAFGRFYASIESDFRNDNSVIETYLLRLRGDYRTDGFSMGAAVARRRIDVDFLVADFLRPYVDTTQHSYSTESGLRLRVARNDWAFYMSGYYHDYDARVDRLAARLDGSNVPIALRPFFQAQLDAIRARLRSATFRSLRLAGQLVDYSATAGVDYQLGAHLLNLEYLQTRETLSEVRAQSLEAGWVLPLGTASDLEIRAGGARYEDSGTAYYGSIGFTIYR